MDRKLMIDWITEGTISIPVRLIQSYKKLDLTENEMMLIIHVYTFLQQGNSFPTPQLLAKQMCQSEHDCLYMLQSLVKRGFIEIQEQNNDNNILSEAFSLAPLWDRLLLLAAEQKQKSRDGSKEEAERNLYQMFEAEFARPLSPMEGELITIWLDQENYQPPLVRAALMEAVVSGKRNLRYIDRILNEWSKNGVRTVQEAKQYGERFRNQQQSTAGEVKKKIPSYNWLKN